MDMFRLSYALPDPFLMHDLSPRCNKRNTTGNTSGAGIAYSSGAHEYIPSYQWGSCCSILSFLYTVLKIAVCPVVLFPVVIVFLSFSDLWLLVTLQIYIFADEDTPVNIIIACIVTLTLISIVIMIILVIWFKLKKKTTSTTWPNTTDCTPSQRFQISEMSSPTTAISPPLPTSMARTHTSLIRLDISTLCDWILKYSCQKGRVKW